MRFAPRGISTSTSSGASSTARAISPSPRSQSAMPFRNSPRSNAAPERNRVPAPCQTRAGAFSGSASSISSVRRIPRSSASASPANPAKKSARTTVSTLDGCARPAVPIASTVAAAPAAKPAHVRSRMLISIPVDRSCPRRPILLPVDRACAACVGRRSRLAEPSRAGGDWRSVTPPRRTAHASRPAQATEGSGDEAANPGMEPAPAGDGFGYDPGVLRPLGPWTGAPAAPACGQGGR